MADFYYVVTLNSDGTFPGELSSYKFITATGNNDGILIYTHTELPASPWWVEKTEVQANAFLFARFLEDYDVLAPPAIQNVTQPDGSVQPTELYPLTTEHLKKFWRS